MPGDGVVHRLTSASRTERSGSSGADWRAEAQDLWRGSTADSSAPQMSKPSARPWHYCAHPGTPAAPQSHLHLFRDSRSSSSVNEILAPAFIPASGRVLKGSDDERRKRRDMRRSDARTAASSEIGIPVFNSTLHVINFCQRIESARDSRTSMCAILWSVTSLVATVVRGMNAVVQIQRSRAIPSSVRLFPDAHHGVGVYCSSSSAA